MVSLDDAGHESPDVRAVTDPLLRTFVADAWIRFTRAHVATRECRRVVPDPSPHILIVVGRDGSTRAGVVGARTTFADISNARAVTVGVRLLPGAMPALFGVDGQEVRDQVIPLCDVLSDTDRALDLARAGDPHACLNELLCVLKRRASHAGERDWRVRGFEHALAQPGHPTVASLARSLGLTERTCRAVITSHTGLSPRLWMRIDRLHRALTQMKWRGGRSLARIAAETSYHDESHMVHDFHALLGETPSRFLSRSANSYKAD